MLLVESLDLFADVEKIEEDSFFLTLQNSHVLGVGTEGKVNDLASVRRDTKFECSYLSAGVGTTDFNLVALTRHQT